MTTKTMTPKTTMVICPCPRCYLGAHDLPALAEKYRRVSELQTEAARLREENAELKQGKVFVDPKWICDLETQLAKAHEELCQAGLREYGN